jgi:hypothetical protein
MCMIELLDGADSCLFTLVRHKKYAYDHTFHTMSYVGRRSVSHQLLKEIDGGGNLPLAAFQIQGFGVMLRHIDEWFAKRVFGHSNKQWWSDAIGAEKNDMIKSVKMERKHGERERKIAFLYIKLTPLDFLTNDPDTFWLWEAMLPPLHSLLQQSVSQIWQIIWSLLTCQTLCELHFRLESRESSRSFKIGRLTFYAWMSVCLPRRPPWRERHINDVTVCCDGKKKGEGCCGI